MQGVILEICVMQFVASELLSRLLAREQVRASASHNLFIISKRGPDNSAEYWGFLYLYGNHWYYYVPRIGAVN